METTDAWYLKQKEEALRTHKTSLEAGLSHAEVQHLSGVYGENRIKETKRRRPLRILLSQFTDFMVLVLIGAAIIAGILGEPQDIAAIAAIVLLNAILGFVQEYRAERAIEALRSLAAPHAKVRRQGAVVTVPTSALVPGDIALLEAGDLVPADLRLVEAHQLAIDESALTGESNPVHKQTDSIDIPELPLGDQKNMSFKGTLVTVGRGAGVVVHTGMNTELGRIATLLHQEVEVKTPLQERIALFARRLAILVLALCAVIFIAGLLRGEEALLMFMTALSLAVAAIPEALPAVVTVALAIGARRMSRKNALVRKLPAVETLGSVTVICTDKTGTLTENRMKAVSLFFDDRETEKLPPLSQASQEEALFLRMLALSNDATETDDGEVRGEPTEIALLRAAIQSGCRKKDLSSRYPRVSEIPFTSERGLMSTIHQDQRSSRFAVYTKGAPERLLPLCRRMLTSGGEQPLDETHLNSVIDSMAGKGLRVLAFAYKELPEFQPSEDDLKGVEENLIFVGLVGLMDPPRPEVKDAIRMAQSAGVRIVMITGDHQATARAIAADLGILKNSEAKVITGSELRRMSDHELNEGIEDFRVFARAAPEQKIRIVKALQESGEVVAMTGDGVNDAPALRRAGIGVSMGRCGTDVAREASHMVLLDDNFATIVSAIAEGRRIYDNIRKFIRFALSGNSGEIWTLFLAPFIGLPVPLLPIQILWVNLVTDGLPGLALAVEPPERHLMKRGPRPPGESILAQGLGQQALWVGILIAALTLATQAWAISIGSPNWQTMTFTVLTFTQMAQVMAIRSERESLFTQGLLSNLPLLGAVLLTFVLQFLLVYVPWCNAIFRTSPLSASELLFCLLISFGTFIAIEIEKWCRRRPCTPNQVRLFLIAFLFII